MPATFDLNGPFHGLIGKPYGVSRLSTGSAMAAGHITSPFISAYPLSLSGIGAKFANPSTLPPAKVNGVAFNHNATAIFLANDIAPSLTAYAWNRQTGWGTKFADPATVSLVPGEAVAYNKALSGAHDHVALADGAGGSAIYISAYKFNANGWSTKFTAPAAKPLGAGTAIAFQKNGTALAISFVASPFVNAYPWSNSGFGVKYANPTVLPTGGVNVAFSRDGVALVVSHTTVGGKNLTAWTFNAGFGAKYADPLYPAAWVDSGQSLAFTKDCLIVGTTLSANYDQYISWRFDSVSGFGARFGQLARIPQAINAVAVNIASTVLVGSQSQGVVRFAARRWSDTSGYGVPFTNPATLPTGAVNALAIAA